jgi:Zn-finger nucleic acid-binding protein
MAYKCYFCNLHDLKDIKMQYENILSQYLCPRCGDVYLDRETAGDILGEDFTE